jgi:hypothetical protein
MPENLQRNNSTALIIIIEATNEGIANKLCSKVNNNNINLRINFPEELKNESILASFNFDSCKKKDGWKVIGRQICKPISTFASQKEIMEILTTLNLIIEAQNRNGFDFLSKIKNISVKFKFPETKKEITIKKQQCSFFSKS